MENSKLPIILSNRLKNILHKINDSISNTILNLDENNDFIYPFSFLDITNNDGTISFLQVNKYNNLEIEKGNGDIVWTTNYRNSLKPGRLINKLTPFYNDMQIEDWVNKFKNAIKESQNNINFKIVDGENILLYYNNRSYSSGNGSLNKSCMRHSECSSYMKLYSKNPNKIKMVILLDDNSDLITGRALLWKLDEPENTWLLDRIYVKDDSDVILFKNFAKKNGWLYKDKQTFNYNNVIINGEEQFINMKVFIQGKFTHFPYIDTLLYYNTKENYLTNNEYDYKNIPGVIKLRDINGRDSGNEHFAFDSFNSDYINISDAIFCYYEDSYIHKNSAFYMSDLDEYVGIQNLRYSTYHKKFISKTHSVYSYNLKSFIEKKYSLIVYLTNDQQKSDFYLARDLGKTFNLNKDDQNFYINDLLEKTIDNKYTLKNKKKTSKKREINKEYITLKNNVGYR